MENKGGHAVRLHTCIHEFFGTAFLVLSINSTSINKFQAFAVSIMLLSQICYIGPTSGCHLNPAVTIGVLVCEFKQRRVENIIYAISFAISQICGAFFGTFLSFMVQKKDYETQTIFPGVASLCPAVADEAQDKDEKCSIKDMHVQAMLAELMGTFVLVFIILTVKYSWGSKDLQINAFVIGTALMSAIAMTANFSGGGLNPAVAIAQQSFQNIMEANFPGNNNRYMALDAMAVYILAPLGAGAIAGFLQLYLGNVRNQMQLAEDEVPKSRSGENNEPLVQTRKSGDDDKYTKQPEPFKNI